MISKIVYSLGEMKYNAKIKEKYKWLKETEEWSLEELEKYQTEKLKELLIHAYENSEYYKKKYDEYGVHPSDFSKLEDIKLFPTLQKNELREKTSEILIDYSDKEKLYYSETSGSTGEPLVFYRNQSWDAVHRASIKRGYSWHGVQPHEKNGYFWGYNLDTTKALKIKFLDILQNRFRIFSYDSKNLDRFLKNMKNARYIEGYSSMVYEVAKKVNENKGEYYFPELKMIKGTSEKIFDTYKEEVNKAFGLNFISEYGSAEAGIIAFECGYGNMHITMENVVVEIEGDEIVVTNLSSYSYPIIRYKLGDYIELKDKEYKCECGLAHPIIESVLGRVGKTIEGVSNNFPSLTLYYVFKNMAIKGHLLYYQAVQRAKGELELNVEQSLTAVQKELLLIELNKYFGEELKIILNEAVTLDRRDGKMRDFISMI